MLNVAIVFRGYDVVEHLPWYSLHFSIDRFILFVSAIVFKGLHIHPISSSGGFKDVLELTHSGGNEFQFDFLIFVAIVFDFNQQLDNYRKFVDRVIH